MKTLASQGWPVTDQPKAFCGCGHTGDGPNSQHEAGYGGPAHTPGHGACTVKGCKCLRFRWDRWTPAYKKLRNAVRKAGAV